MMNRPFTIVLLVLIAAAILFLLSRRDSGPAGDSSPSRTGSRENAILAGRPTDRPAESLPSKSGARAPRARSKAVTTASGLRYEILAEGTGPRPGPTDMVNVHYHGTTLDGTVFDSTIERGKPATFPLNRVIKGWTEGLQLMPVGSKYRFTIPPELAYGKTGAGDKIGPDATLVFEIELLEIPPKP